MTAHTSYGRNALGDEYRDDEFFFRLSALNCVIFVAAMPRLSRYRVRKREREGRKTKKKLKRVFKMRRSDDAIIWATFKCKRCLLIQASIRSLLKWFALRTLNISVCFDDNSNKAVQINRLYCCCGLQTTTHNNIVSFWCGRLCVCVCANWFPCCCAIAVICPSSRLM